ncbi:MAG: hypothetical protein AAF329_25205 [Cyanobacteria bacterium P01_A01_bin.17]
MKDTLLNGLNTLLMLNVFFVMFSFVWFVAALLGESFGIPLGFQLWLSLWEPVFTPAIGVLMGGAVLTGLLGQIFKRLQSS